MFNRKLKCILAACAFGALTLSAQSATTSGTRTLAFPVFGLGSTETARVSVVNTATASSSGTAASCTGSISFINATGATIGTATSFTIASGVISSASLPFASSGLSSPRGDLRAQISLTVTSGTPCELGASLSTFDTSSGATHLFESGGVSGGYGGGPGR